MTPEGTKSERETRFLTAPRDSESHGPDGRAIVDDHADEAFEVKESQTTENAFFGRRSVLKTIGFGVALGASSGLAGAQEGSDELSRQLNGVRAATGAYRDVETARADGYEPLLGYFPGMGFHFTNRDPPLGADRDDPPLLVYFTNGSYNPDPGDPHDPDRDADLILGGVEYLVAGNQEADPPDIFADEESSRALQVTESEGWHFEADLDITGLHAWIHRGNPAGVFHPTNPTID